METEKELRELDVWVAKNVTLWKPTVDSGVCWDDSGKMILSVPYYTKGDNILEVLEKCLEKTEKQECAYIGKLGDEWIMGHETIEVTASTLPLAIVKLAKALYSK